MAQTIALYRGMTTVSHNTITTLFTNTASGTSTMMYFSYGSFRWVTGATNYIRCSLSVLRSGAGSNDSSVQFGAVVDQTGTAIRKVVFPISDQSGVNGRGGVRWNALNVNANNMKHLYTGSDDFRWNVQVNAAAFGLNKFIIGPSDEIKVYQYNSAADSAQLSYCFVGITES